VPHSPDDKRVLFQRVVDDVLDQIRDGRLQPNDPLPSARNMAELYGVASMTAQRALRELQHQRITYSVAGKGTFVHPDAFDVLRGGALREPINDPGLRQQVASYLAEQQAIVARYHGARSVDTRNAALVELIAHAETHKKLIDEATRHQADRGNFAQQPEWLNRPGDDTAPAQPAKRSGGRSRKPKT
jgi:DNA-binding transcriptional regulator YhcF (GntR family)